MHNTICEILHIDTKKIENYSIKCRERRKTLNKIKQFMKQGFHERKRGLMIIVHELNLVKRHIIFVDSKDGETIEVYKNRLVPSSRTALGSWLIDFVEIILDKDPESLLTCGHTTVEVVDGLPSPSVVVPVDYDTFVKGSTYGK